MAHIEHYFVNRVMGDKVSSGNSKAVEKGQDLLNSKKVDACSFAVVEGDFFVTGIVRAAMKRKVGYNYKLKFDERGEIQNSHCECPAGKGPVGSCKHAAAVCLLLHELREKGVLRTSLSCTERLQTFHHPTKRHTGSPVKGEDLTVPSQSHTCLDDPRPAKYRRMEGYTDRVRSQVTNFCFSSGMDLAFRYTWDKANLTVAMDDHDYLQRPFVEYWIDDYNNVDQRDVTRIEALTRKQSKSLMWFREREWRLTASNFGTVTKITERRNITKLCSTLTNPLPLTVPPILHGRHYEPIAIDQFSRTTNLSVEKCGLFVSQEFPFLAATPDGLIGDNAVLEVKCPYAGRDSSISVGKLFPFLCELDGELALKPGHKYYDQVQGQMMITKRQLCYFVVYTFRDLKYFQISFDEEYCTQAMIPKLQCFYVKYYRPFLARCSFQ